jgi:hypothetical protein
MNRDKHNPEIDPQLANMLELLKSTPPRDPLAAAQGRARFLQEAEGVLSSPSLSPFGWLKKKWSGLKNDRENSNMSMIGGGLALKTLATLLTVLILFFGGVGMTALAAQAALPGDILYPVKTTLEQTRLSLTTDSASQAQLHLEFAQRRLDELSAIISSGRLEEINRVAAEFEFHIEKAIAAFQMVAAEDPLKAQELANHIATTLSHYAQTLSSLIATAPETVRPTLTRAISTSRDIAIVDSSRSGEIEFTGAVESISADAWVINDRTVVIAPHTEIKGVIRIGDLVKVHAQPADDGRLVAREIEPARDDDRQGGIAPTISVTPQSEIEFNGIVEAISTTSWTIGGRTVAVTNQTEIKGTIQVGDSVKVHALVAADGSLTAREIEPARDGDHQGGIEPTIAVTPQSEKEFTGTVEAMTGSTWTVAGRLVTISTQTEIKGAIQVGDNVKVHAILAGDGSLVAREIELVATLQPQTVEIRVTGVVTAISPAAWTIDGKSFAITPQTDIRDFIQVGNLVEVRALSQIDGSLIATRIDLKGQEQEIRFTGVVEAVNANTWTVSGQTVVVMPGLTEIKDFIQVGDLVEVRALLGANGILTATRIELDD